MYRQRFGCAKAASSMDELERKGIIGQQDGAKPRKIFYPKGMEAPAPNQVE
jgi:hypothetical protein